MMLKKIFSVFMQNYRKFLPTAILLLLLTLAGATDIFSVQVQESMRSIFLEYLQKLQPFAINLVIAGILANLAWLFYKPIWSGFEVVLARTEASAQGKDLSLKLFKFFYWAIVVFLVLSLTAADFLGRFVVGFGVFGAALTLSMQGAANDFICGLLIQFCRKVSEKDEVMLVGLDVKGKISQVGMLSTIVETSGELIHVPNREVWSRAVKVFKPAKSSILLPPGSEYPKRG